jgi:hypothetical protein
MDIFGSLKRIDGFGGIFKRHHKVRNPARDWTILLIVTLVLLMVVSAISVWMYLRVQAGDFSRSEEETLPVLTVDRAKLSDVLSKWEMRERSYLEATVFQKSLVDPRR